MSCVYKHTFPNGEVYIGKTNMRPEDRWLNGWGYRTSPLMFNAIIKYGWDNVQHEIIADGLTEHEAFEREQQEINAYSKSCTMYNIQSIPAQCLAQENTHFIDKEYPPQTPAQLPNQNRPHRKNYIVPLTIKPQGLTSCPINVYTKNGEYITTYPSAKIAALELGVNNGDVISCCKGKKADGTPRYQVKGYIFRYAV